MQQMLFCNSPPGRNLQRAGVARNTKAFLLFQRFATVTSAHLLFAGQTENHVKKSLLLSVTSTSRYHTPRRLLRSTGTRTTPPIITIFWESSEREKKIWGRMRYKYHQSVTLLEYLRREWLRESNEEQERGSTAGELVRSILIVFPGLLEPCSSRLFA